MWQFMAQAKPHEVITGVAAIISVAIAVGALIVSLYGMSLSWKTMVLLHRPFIALTTVKGQETELRDNATGGFRIHPGGGPFPLAQIRRTRVGFVFENTGTALAEDLTTEIVWFQSGHQWTTPKGGAAEVAPRQVRTILADIEGDAVRKAAGGQRLKGLLKLNFRNSLGDIFQTSHYFWVQPSVEGATLNELLFVDMTKEAWSSF